MDNAAVAAALWEWADILEMERPDDPFRPRAYRRAADTVASLDEPVERMLARGDDLTLLPGIGASLAQRIDAIVAGTWEELDAARRRHGLAGPADDSVSKGASVNGPAAGALTLSGPAASDATFSDAAASDWAASDRAASDPAAPGDGLKGGTAAATQALQDALHGDLHTHTQATDGRASIREMALAAQRRGYEYVAITDHSKATRIAGGLDADGMRAHLDDIRRVDEEIEGITVLAGAEVDILKDGRLDYPAFLLRDMDVTVCSVHQRHKLTGAEQTQRILAGMAHDHAHILGHPTARRKGIRPAMQVDLARLVDAAREQGWALEMNGSPERLDLDALGAAMAAEAGVAVALGSDAHATAEFANVRNACRQAALAGLGPDDVLNALPLAALRRRLL